MASRPPHVAADTGSLPPYGGPFVPIAYTLSDVSPACNVTNRTYWYHGTQYLTPNDPSASAFAVPEECDTLLPPPCASTPGISVVWVAVGCVAALLAGLGVGVLVGRRLVWRNGLARREVNLQAAYSKALLDAV